MNACLRARKRGLERELRLLDFSDLSDLEQTSEDEGANFCRSNPRVISLGYPHECSRCGAVTRVIGRDPYCTECNWDSLRDPCLEVLRWAA
jgi:hypothetical protein